MFDFFEKCKEKVIGAPVKGSVFDCSKVNDPTFAQELLGEGVAINPVEGKVFSPVDGEIAMVMESKHAVSLEADWGAEILIHVGIDTVNLKGEHFTAHVSNGDAVKKGDLLLEFDMDAIKDKGYDLDTIVVVCNSSDYDKVEKNTDTEVEIGDTIISLK